MMVIIFARVHSGPYVEYRSQSLAEAEAETPAVESADEVTEPE